MCRRPTCRRREAVIVGIEGGGELPVRHECADGIRADDAMQLPHILARRATRRRNEGEQGDGIRARIDIEREFRKIKSREHGVHILDRRDTRTEVADLLRLTRVNPRT